MVALQGRRITLIGGSGFIGHNLALKLKEVGAEVSIVDSLMVNNLLTFASTGAGMVSPNSELYLNITNRRLQLLRQAQIPLYIQDARDYVALSRLLSKLQPQVIVHLAAVAHANRSNKDPYSTFDHSFRTLENALDYSRGGDVEQFVYFSSSMIYGHFLGGQVTEETPCEPIGIYGALKFGGEKLVIAYNQVFGLPYTIIRPSALYGERCVSRRVGQIFIENALKGAEITISGDGSDRLDFTYIDDMVAGMLRVIECEAARNEVFNLTYGESRSLSDLAEILRSCFKNIQIIYVPKDRLIPDRGTLSVNKARRLLSYDPRWPLEKGMLKYIGWYRDLPPEFTSGGALPVTDG